MSIKLRNKSRNSKNHNSKNNYYNQNHNNLSNNYHLLTLKTKIKKRKASSDKKTINPTKIPKITKITIRKMQQITDILNNNYSKSQPRNKNNHSITISQMTL